MIRKLQRRFALSEKGAKDVLIGSICCALQNLAFMLPVGILYLMVKDLMEQRVGSHVVFYIIGCVVAAVLILITTYFQYNGTYLATYLETGTRRISLAEKLRKLPLSFFSKKDLADLSGTLMTDCAVLESSQSHYVSPLIGAVLSTVLIGIALLCMNWRLGIAALWPLPIAFAIIAFSSNVQVALNKMSNHARITQEEGIQEYLESIKDLRSCKAERTYLDGLSNKIYDVEKKAFVTEFGTAAFVIPANLILKLGIATTALVGGFLLVQGELDLLTYFMFLIVASRFYDPMEGTLQDLAAIIATSNNIARMNEILDHPVQEGTEILSNQGTDIVFDHIAFSYDDGENVLRDVSFTAKQGTVTALVGPSGGGKTTVSRLAARFWDPTSGTITVGGMDVTTVDPETLMSLYSIVFQDVTLFNNTVFENIRIGNPNATDEEVMQAGRLAHVDAFAEKLPEGWHTQIGENGSNLSGGERQRISIARAFLKDAPIILLDEATASLDVDNETLIQTAISELIKDKTVLVIAHRMRTVSGADKIVVLKDGIVAEQGEPDELMKQDGIFAEMQKQQVQSQNWVM